MRNLLILLHFLFAIGLTTWSMDKALAQTPWVTLDQGPNWNAARRDDFYSRDQGSRMISFEWLRALKQANGQPFLADSLGRYGYLSNPAGVNGLPAGFTASGPVGAQTVGMTCSACHTRQINVEGTAYRIDGGPAIVDFQGLLNDLDVAVGAVLSSDATFLPFATSVLGSLSPESADVAALHQNVSAWYSRYHTLMAAALPRPPSRSWGLGRLDAVGMIFNRLVGLDLGPAPSLIISENIKTADAPVRYPFIWNAPRQDKTQWPSFADNGSDVLALARNLGEVFGVFGIFQPKKDGLFINYLNNNSANFDGLTQLESLVKQIGPPKWPWQIDMALAAQGKGIYDRSAAQGGCTECHGVRSGKIRFPLVQTWDTPTRAVGTDTRQYDVLGWRAKTGVLQGAFIPLVTQPLKETDLAFNILATSVLGTIAQHVLDFGGSPPVPLDAPGAAPAFKPVQLSGPLPPALRDLQGAFTTPGVNFEAPGGVVSAPVKGTYEARVLQGIWATAPYLHNGSVPTLRELLKPATERIKKFKVGPAYDISNVGLAAVQTLFNYEFEATDCSDRNSGDSLCGHEYGTQLTLDEKQALLEYLKTL
jgi:processive rubber oxygenase RoxA-like protein